MFVQLATRVGDAKTIDPSTPHPPRCPLLGTRFPRVCAGLGGSRNTILHQLGPVNRICPVPDCIRTTRHHSVLELPSIICFRTAQYQVVLDLPCTILYQNYKIYDTLINYDERMYCFASGKWCFVLNHLLMNCVR